MNANRNGIAVLAATAAVVVAAIVVISFAGPRGAATPSPSPSASASTSALPSPTASASGTPTASRAASVVPGSTSGRYASPIGYVIELPSPWHKGSCQVLTQANPEPGGEEFVPVAAKDEVYSDIGAPFSVLDVFAEANPQNITPRQWAEQGKTIGGTAGERIEDVTFGDRTAARKTIPGTSLASYFVGDRGRMVVVSPRIKQPLEPALEQAIARIVNSFAFLTDAQRAAARAALPPAPAPRTPEQVADALAAAFSAKDVTALAEISAPCIFAAGEQAGGTTWSRERYLDDLRAKFASGLVVTVAARPIDGDRATDHATIASTWKDASGTKDRKLVIRRGVNDHWEWAGTLERFS